MADVGVVLTGGGEVATVDVVVGVVGLEVVVVVVEVVVCGLVVVVVAGVVLPQDIKTKESTMRLMTASHMTFFFTFTPSYLLNNFQDKITLQNKIHLIAQPASPPDF